MFGASGMTQTQGIGIGQASLAGLSPLRIAPRDRRPRDRAHRKAVATKWRKLALSAGHARDYASNKRVARWWAAPPARPPWRSRPAHLRMSGVNRAAFTSHP